MLLRVKVVTGDFKKFYVTISCHGDMIVGAKMWDIKRHLGKC